MAGFQVIMYGRFWVFTEDFGAGGTRFQCQFAATLLSAPHRMAEGHGRHPLPRAAVAATAWLKCRVSFYRAGLTRARSENGIIAIAVN